KSLNRSTCPPQKLVHDSYDRRHGLNLLGCLLGRGKLDVNRTRCSSRPPNRAEYAPRLSPQLPPQLDALLLRAISRLCARLVSKRSATALSPSLATRSYASWATGEW